MFERLWRRPAIWSDTSLWPGAGFPLLPEPVPAPRVPAGTAEPIERPGSTKTGQLLGHGGVFHGGGDVRRDSFWKGGDLRRPVRQRGMDYLRALLVTPYD